MKSPNRTQKFLTVIRDNPGCTNAFAVEESGAGNKNTGCEFVSAGYIEMVARLQITEGPYAVRGPKRMWANTYRITPSGLSNILKGQAPPRKRKATRIDVPLRIRRGSAQKVKIVQTIEYPVGYKHTMCPTGLCQSVYNPADSRKLTGLATWS